MSMARIVELNMLVEKQRLELKAANATIATLRATVAEMMCDLGAQAVEIDNLQKDLGEAQHARNVAVRKLQHVVSFPHTADGHLVMVGYEVWHPDDSEPMTVGGHGVQINQYAAGNEMSGAEVCECYSTREAANAAKGG
jgi:hypothetical protein